MDPKDFLPSWLPPGVAVTVAAAATGLVISFWSRIQAFFSRMSTHLIDVVKVDAELAAELMTHLGQNADTSQFGGKAYTVMSRYYRPVRRQQWLLARWVDPEGSLTFWYRVTPAWFPRWLASMVKTVPVWVDRGKGGTQMTFRFVRGTFPVERLLKEFCDHVNSKTSDRYKLVRIGGTGRQVEGKNQGGGGGGSVSTGFTRLPATSFFVTADPKDLGEPRHQGGPADLWLAPEVSSVLEDARSWMKRRAWYSDRGLPWRRGYLVHGRPGTGKTSLARAIGIDLDFPIYSLDLGSMTNQDLAAAFATARSDAPCMILLEDFDSVYDGRKAIQANPQLGTPPDFGQILNQIQGVENNDGIMVFITTNHMRSVDQALGGPNVDGVVFDEARPRPGRVDIMMETPDTISEEGRRHIATKMLPLGAWGDLIETTHNMTPAQYHEAVLQKSLTLQFDD